MLTGRPPEADRTATGPSPSNPPARIVAVIPAYNEERFIGSMVLHAARHADAVIVVDDGSTDATAAIAAQAGAIVASHEHNRGKGVALNTGFRQAAALRPEVVVTLDADGQHLAGEIETVIQPVLAGQADLVIGSRYLRAGAPVPAHRALGHQLFTFMTNRASGLAVSDSQSGFRAFSRRALETITFHSPGFSVESEMQFLAHDHDLKLVEVPVTIRYPDPPKRPVIQHGLLVLNGLLQLVGQYRPLFYFGLPGLVLTLLGLGLGVWTVDIYRRTQELAVGYALISVMLFLLGNMSLTTGIILHSVRGLLLHHLPQPPEPRRE